MVHGMRRHIDGPKWLLARSQVQRTGCWTWTRSLDDHGYARYAGGYAHRKVYAEYLGPIPAGMVLHHRCYVRSCVNPYHLEPKTRGQHIAEHCAARPRVPRAAAQRKQANRQAQARWLAWRREKGGCRQCRARAVVGRALCAEHLERQRTRKRELRAAARSAVAG